MAKSTKLSGSDRRDRIVRAALDCYIRDGVAQTTLRDIARKAKVDQPLIHYYFRSTEDLYTSVIEVVLNSLKEASVTPSMALPDAVRTLSRYIEGTFEWAQEQPGYFSIWMYFYYLASFNPTFTKMNHLIRTSGRDRIALMIHRGVEQGHLSVPKTQNVQDLALNIQGLMTGNCVMAASEGGDWKHYTQLTVQGCLSWLSKPSKS